jgi:hypothetical protein
MRALQSLRGLPTYLEEGVPRLLWDVLDRTDIDGHGV